jgi:hypothetical protein
MVPAYLLISPAACSVASKSLVLPSMYLGKLGRRCWYSWILDATVQSYRSSSKGLSQDPKRPENELTTAFVGSCQPAALIKPTIGARLPPDRCLGSPHRSPQPPLLEDLTELNIEEAGNSALNLAWWIQMPCGSTVRDKSRIAKLEGRHF